MESRFVLLLLLVAVLADTAFSGGWWNESWQYRRAITLSETRNITRTNEPVYVTISGTDGRIANCTKELRITDSNGIEIPSQVDLDSVAGGTYSCSIAFLANASGLSSTAYYAYYGNPFASAPSYPSQDPSFSVTSSLLKNSYYNLPTDGHGVYLPSFSSAGSGSYDISMATNRPYCDNLRWELSVTQNGTGYEIGGSSGCTGYSVPWSVGKNGSVFKEVFARLAPTGSASYLWRLRLFPKSRYIEMFADANISAPVNFTRAAFNLVPSGHSTAWDQSSSASSSTFYVNTNSSWGTYGSGSVIFGNIRNVTLSASVAGWEGGVGLHDSAAFLYLPSNVLTCTAYPCIAASPSLRAYWTTDYSVAANRITGRMLDSPLSVSVSEQQSQFISMGVSPQTKTTYPSYNEAFSLWLYNNQTISDNFALSCTGTCTYSENPVATTPYQNKSVVVTITSANISGTTAYTVTATSQANTSNSASITASITVDATKWRDDWTDAYGNGFRYRIPITVTNSGNSTLTDYQVNVTIDTASPISAGKMRSDCGDIRMTNGTNEIPYWVESGCNTSSTKIWARVPYVPVGNSTVYAYYGNTAAAGESNGDATFEFFDGFPGTSLNASKWTELDDAGALTPSVSGNVLTLSYNGNDRGYVYRNIAQGNSNIAVEMEAYDDYISGSNVNWGKIIVAPAHGNDVHTGAAIVFEALQMDGTHKLFVKDVNYNYNAAVEWPETTFRRIKFTRFNSTVKAYVEDVEKASATGESDAGDYISLGGQIVDNTAYTYNRVTKYKNVRVRKFASTEPSSSPGAEQTKGYRALVRRCGLKQPNTNVTAYSAGNATASCIADSNGICLLEMGAGTYNVFLQFPDNSTAWKNGTVFE